MSAGAIAGVARQPATPSINNQFAELSTEKFIKVMITEMANQDPFDPQDSSALLEQLSSIRNIESQLVLQEKLDSLVLQNQLATAGTLIGQTVSGLDALNQVVTGMVTSMRIVDGKAVLGLNTGASLAFDRVTSQTNNSSAPQNQIMIAANLIGRKVTGLETMEAGKAAGELPQAPHEITGIVAALNVVDGRVVLELDAGRTLELDHVRHVSSASGPTPAVE